MPAFLANIIIYPIEPVFLMILSFTLVVLIESLIFHIKCGSWPEPLRPAKIFAISAFDTPALPLNNQFQERGNK